MAGLADDIPPNMMLVGGDMLMHREEYSAFRYSVAQRRHKRMAHADENRRWRNATIYYTIAMTYYYDNNLKEMQWAIDQFEQETCLKFKMAQPDTPNYAIVRVGSGGCNAQLGQAYDYPAGQSVNLGNGCKHYGLYLHEFGHMIGLYHEHQHPDRDTEINVDMNNVDPSMRQWFEHETEPFKTFGAPYDVQSVMHYGETAFSSDGKSITMRTKDPKRQRHLTPVWVKDMSFYDAWKINAMYKCASHCKNVNCPADNFINKDCQCVSKQDFANKRCINVRSDQECAGWADTCDSNFGFMYKYCRKTCGRCYIAE